MQVNHRRMYKGQDRFAEENNLLNNSAQVAKKKETSGNHRANIKDNITSNQLSTQPLLCEVLRDTLVFILLETCSLFYRSYSFYSLFLDSYVCNFCFCILTLDLCKASLKTTFCDVGSLLKDLIYYYYHTYF